jgi:uncharacterized protein (DUF2147 family)/fucose 4-O-acetylase-like acetyltransferase
MERRPDIDWLRVIATYLLFVYHVGKIFDPAPFFHLRNSDLWFGMLVACGFISLWHMPLFFLLAGWSAASSLRVRGRRAFLAERVRRLGIPLVAGCVLLGPVIKYAELRSGLDLSHTGLRVAPALLPGFHAVIPSGLPVLPPFDEGFLAFLPTFFTRLERFSWAHLWFIAYLLALTVAYLPLIGWLVGRADRLARVPRLAVYAPVVPLVAVQLTLRARWPGIYNLYDDWANVAYYSVFLLAGSLLACHPALERAVDREWKRSLAVGLGTTGLLLLAVLGIVPGPAILLAGSAVAGWCLVIGAVGLARRHLAGSGPVLRYLSESAFPVYVLHQAAIVVPGYFIVRLALGIAPKFVLLVVVAVATTLATYEWLVRPFAGPRFLLGMRRKARARRAAALSPSAAALARVVAVAAPVMPARAATPVGLWYAEGGAARVAIEPCGPALCGRVVWLRAPFDEEGCEVRDRHNPDTGLRDRPLLGLEILRGLVPQADGSWTGGRIYDPTSGHTYACRVTVEGEDRLRLRGYLGIPLLGRTTTWTRVGREQRACRAR